MALSTYSDLQTALSAWLDGSPLAGREGDFIALCEDEMNARLAAAIDQGSRIRPMISRSTLLLTGEYIDLPDADSDMIRPVSIEVQDLDFPWVLRYVSEENLLRMKFDQDFYREAAGASVGSEAPIFYTMVGSQLRLLPAPETTYSSEFIRYVKVPALSDGSPTNWVLANHYNAYLYGSLIQAEGFGWNHSSAQIWADKFEAAMTGIVARYPVPVDQTPLTSELGSFGFPGGLTLNSFMNGRF